MTYFNEGYCFIPWRRSPLTEEGEEQGFEPDLPENVYSELLAFMGDEPGSQKPFPALYFVRWSDDASKPQGMKLVTEDLATLLKAGRVYPPAIAIARNAIHKLSGTEDAAEAGAAEQFTNALRHELENQRHRPFFLAKSLTWELIGYRKPGDYCWILRYDPRRKEPLWYVSEDYFAYTCPVTDFDVDVDYLCERFGVPQEATQDK